MKTDLISRVAADRGVPHHDIANAVLDLCSEDETWGSWETRIAIEATARVWGCSVGDIWKAYVAIVR
ncbi:MAG: hypothetical protein EBR05_09045 [Marivivens sp.]|nr:hypothetical protein [Marivivens sp.]NBX09934.1 hypothetical protein [Marivivens sp.]NDH04285.1 hypothetical protein [Marivivens sp.]